MSDTISLLLGARADSDMIRYEKNMASITGIFSSNDYLNEVLFDKPKNLRRIYIPETGVLLQPHKVYLAKTIERVKIN